MSKFMKFSIKNFYGKLFNIKFYLNYIFFDKLAYFVY